MCHIFTQDRFWPLDIVVNCVCLCLCVRVSVPSLVQSRTTKFVEKMQNTLVKIVIVCRVDWPWTSMSDLTKKSKLTHKHLLSIGASKLFLIINIFVEIIYFHCSYATSQPLPVIPLLQSILKFWVVFTNIMISIIFYSTLKTKRCHDAITWSTFGWHNNKHHWLLPVIKKK